MSKIITWSFSKLNEYDNCPYKHQQVSVLKNITDEWNDEAKLGIKDHESLESRLLKNKPLPKHLKRMENVCRIIENAAGSLHPETKFCLNKSLSPVGYKDWKNGWYRCVIDVLKINNTTAWIGDWKTGKVKEDYTQLDLFAATVFHTFPYIRIIRANYIWIKGFTLSPTRIYLRKDAPLIWANQLSRAAVREKSFAENDWPTRVSGLCKSYCIVNKMGKCPDITVPQYKVKK